MSHRFAYCVNNVSLCSLGFIFFSTDGQQKNLFVFVTSLQRATNLILK